MRESAREARKRALASEIEIAGALHCAGAIHRPAPALSSSLCRCSPHPVPALFLRYACVLSCTAPAPFPALCSRSPQHYTGALPRAMPAVDFALRTALYIGLRVRSLQAPALFFWLCSSPQSFHGAIPYAVPALGHAKGARV